MSREVYHDDESIGPCGIGPTNCHCVIINGSKRYEGWGEDPEEAEANAEEKEENDDESEDEDEDE